ncbi:TetR/AcrR family transcriptional regulator [Nocardioides sp. SR21]|uniref:TetR/AcrR family transcriptional regulator n=1 Tax=Nocardioides sp. SR21 TaxID=2919501 RepID=UPI001FA9933B|nr:TetR/AcrR family transcriptional regulator [Nocardioides sp. SR21]
MARKYEQRRRAEQQEETRQRIVEAAIELHGTLGPARTSLSAVAEKAGVQRNTLYRHFPDERELLDACSAHYADLHPVPVPDGWADTEDPLARVRAGLRALYAYWDENQQMVAQVLRDAESVPMVREISQARWGVPLGGIRSALLAGSTDREVEATVDLAIGFGTWQSLRRSGLSTDDAADLMARIVADALSRP